MSAFLNLVIPGQAKRRPGIQGASSGRPGFWIALRVLGMTQQTEAL